MSYGLLTGIRVVDFGILTAGASTSAILADLGAEVIKVEGPQYIDPFRVWTGVGGAEQWWNDSAHYSFTNRNKRNFCVDLKTPQGLRMALDLVQRSDVVVENFRVGVLDNLGLGFDALSARKPNIILASISSQGATGPEAGSVSFGSTLEASSGLSSLIQTEAGVPLISGHALNYPDQVVSLSAATMILSALIERENKSGPIHLDISQRELTAYMLGEYIGAGVRTDSDAQGPGAPAVLQQIAQSGDGMWVALTVPSQAVAIRIAQSLSLVEPISRLAISTWIKTMNASDAVDSLRAVGAMVEIVRTAPELLDENTAASLAFGRDPDGRLVKGLPWRMGAEIAGIDRCAPNLGADNQYIACEILDISQDQYQALVTQGVLASAPESKER